MLSRRNIRIKVMQLLYAQRQDSEQTPALTRRAYEKMVNQSYHTLLFDLYVFVHVLHESTNELKRRKDRIRPTEADLAFQAHLYDNPLIAGLAASVELKAVAKKKGFDALLDEERLRGFYEVAKSYEGYDVYSTQPDPTDDEHLGALLKAHKALMDSDGYTDFIEDRFARWDEDKSLVIGAAKKILKGLPQSGAVLSTYRPDEETKVGFGESLLHYVLDHETELANHIEPVLQNWDAQRVAVVDMILLKMALSELIIFKQIPPKVTLNEYVELAKMYSTDKSKDFVNGILDKLLHVLRAEGLIVKEGRGLIE